ncbi:MAG TPA: tetratricopeptide repeat protein [Chthoniobacterales bacterium]|nr:tetratricopeptide repeat protein [Chthoniobacterales bacterium]
MSLKTFFAELKRRKVYKVAIGYLVGGWALAQGIAQVLPVFETPNWVVRLVVLIIILGFPFALLLSWFFDLTRYGIVRTPDIKDKIDIVPAVSSTDRSIAVLPFTDLSLGEKRDYFGEGIAEEIQTALAKTEGLRVAARRSSFWFKDKKADLKEIADKLNVEHVLEGSVRRDGNRVRISAELTHCGNGFTLWSETFEREMQGIFALQDEITRAIVDALKLKLDISAPLASRLVRSTAAYDVYLHGLFYSDRTSEEDLRKSLEYFERALEKDPQLGRAWTGMAKAWLWLADAYVAPLEAYAKVREAAINALNIDNDDAEAHVYLAETKRILDWDMDGAAREFNRAVELDPKSTPSNYFSAAFWAARGDRDEALIYLQRTSTIDPASLWVNNSACELYRYFGLYDEAIKAGERALQLDPAFVYGEPLLAAFYREMGRYDEAIALYEKAESISGRPAFGLAITYARMKRPDEAREILAKTITSRGSYTPGDAIAHVQMELGAHDDAIRELERACDERSSSLHFVGIAPEFAPLRPDKRFVNIVRRIGLKPEKVFAAGAAR